MGTWDRNGRPRCRKEIFRRRAGRLRRMKGSAMLEAMAVILVFLVMASVLFASGRALNRQTVRTLEKNVARDGALTAVRLLAQDIMEGNRPGEEMEPEKTELEVIPEDGLGTFTVPVTVWAGEEGRNLVLYGMCAYGGQTEAISLLLEKTEESGGGVTPSSAVAPVWPSYGETGGTAEEYRDGPGGPGALQDADRGRNRHIRRGLCAPPDSYRP